MIEGSVFTLPPHVMDVFGQDTELYTIPGDDVGKAAELPSWVNWIVTVKLSRP